MRAPRRPPDGTRTRPRGASAGSAGASGGRYRPAHEGANYDAQGYCLKHVSDSSPSFLSPGAVAPSVLTLPFSSLVLHSP